MSNDSEEADEIAPMRQPSNERHDLGNNLPENDFMNFANENIRSTDKTHKLNKRTTNAAANAVIW